MLVMLLSTFKENIAETGWDLRPFDACLNVNTHLPEQQNTRKLQGTKDNCVCVHWGSPGSTNGKEPARQCQRRRCKRRKFDPWVEKIPWRKKWQPTPVFLPGEVHGQRRLMCFDLYGCKELDTTQVS